MIKISANKIIDLVGCSANVDEERDTLRVDSDVLLKFHNVSHAELFCFVFTKASYVSCYHFSVSTY